MIESSKDILYIVLAFSVLWLAIFLVWLIYYLVTILRQINDILQEAREKFYRVENFFEAFRRKIEHSTASLGLIAEGIKEIVTFWLRRRGRKDKDKKGKK